jgi:hypothetical protein
MKLSRDCFYPTCIAQGAFLLSTQLYRSQLDLGKQLTRSPKFGNRGSAQSRREPMVTRQGDSDLASVDSSKAAPDGVEVLREKIFWKAS